MASHIVGYPRMGPKRELKFALESFWDGKSNAEDLEKVAADLRASIWKQMSDAGIKYIPSNTFSYYGQEIDTTAMLGAVPPRYNCAGGEIGFSTYFSMARGNASVPAMEMTKWFDTNYHFIVPELGPDVRFSYGSHKAVNEYHEDKALGVDTVPVLIGPVTYLLLSKPAKGVEKTFHLLSLVDKILPIYKEVIAELKSAGASWIQFDEPTLVLDLESHQLDAFTKAYAELESSLSGFKDTKLIIIDEYSMLGRAMLANIDYRCRDIFANNEVFGGVSVILVGDMHQLPLVFDSPLYCSGGSFMQQCGTLAYSTFNKCVRLYQIFRQTGEKQAPFRDALNRLSDGTSTIDDWHMFKTRDYSVLNIEEVTTFKYALRLFPTKQFFNNYNHERLISLGNPVARIVSENNCDVAFKAEVDQAKGLEEIICISIGARVMLRANLATHNGLVNGSMGIVVEIVYATNCSSPIDQPLAILVDFDNYNGLTFRHGTNIIPIPPITSYWKSSKEHLVN